MDTKQSQKNGVSISQELESLYTHKGRLTTNIEVSKAELERVNTKIVDLLNKERANANSSQKES